MCVYYRDPLLYMTCMHTINYSININNNNCWASEWREGVIARRKELFLVIRILQIPTTPSTLALTLFATVYDPMRAYACEHMHASMILFCQNNNFFVHWKLVIRN